MTGTRSLCQVALCSLVFTLVLPGTIAGSLPYAILRGCGATLAESTALLVLGATLLAVIAGQAALHASFPLALYAIVVSAGFHLFVIGCEEPALRGRFDGAYDRYCATVPRWLPRLRSRAR